MKYKLILFASLMISFNIALSMECESSKEELKKLIEKSTLGIRKVQLEILERISPELNEVEFDDLVEKIHATHYGSENELMSSSDIENKKRLEDLRYKESLIPTKQELENYRELIIKKDPSENEFKEIQKISLKIHKADLNNYREMTLTEKNELSSLIKRSIDHQERIKQYIQSQLVFSNYLKKKIFKKIKKGQKEETSSIEDTIPLIGESVDIDIPRKNLDSKDEFESGRYPLFISNLKNKAGQDIESTRSYDIIGTTDFLEIILTPTRLKEPSKYNEILKDFVLNSTKTWKDFNYPEIESSWGGKVLEEITGISGEVRTVFNFRTSEISVGYRTMIFNSKGEWINFPSQYVTLDELIKLLPLKSCK